MNTDFSNRRERKDHRIGPDSLTTDFTDSTDGNFSQVAEIAERKYIVAVSRRERKDHRGEGR